MKILVTGGLGYIGSHISVELMLDGNDVTIVDNLDNSYFYTLEKINIISGREVKFIKADVRDFVCMCGILSNERFDAVIHLAGAKSLHESIRDPIKYYENNVCGTIVLLKAMERTGIKMLVFSSSATVYGIPSSSAITESFPLKPNSPYGMSKLMVEQILQDKVNSDASWRIAILRFFNPVGAHPSGLIGDAPKGIPNNLIPYVVQVAAKHRDVLSIYGNDYNTLDGSAIRDYIHVVDLARGHLQALQKLKNTFGVVKYNLGTGVGTSVLQIVQAFENATGEKVPYLIAPRRLGDIDQYFADSSLAEKELGWKASRNVKQMCEDAWRFHVRSCQ
ncbi:UDP-glucose 4-epimerase GalE [Duganella levis]|uniref:UDP-glucose 4-epimerase n=1 Tax=Duganella levis TaxID=2692169 RepID=A0ABW9W7P2_9BURK|nr:UDP-glucose 4-epimerase GalE [Duganella levis]MYN30107.1 UDP-glucose 4-epimerase GalE [Duganella levis]